MTLLNGILALGGLAFSVPLVIHLLFRSRFRTIEWGAMHLLQSVVRINRRRLQLLHLLLLLLRCLLPVLLAFCLARPVLTGFRSLPGDAPQSLLIAIDDSRSMAARDESGLTRMDRAKQGLGELLQGLSRQDEVLLLPSSRVASPVPAGGAQEARSHLRQLRTESGPVDLGTWMRAAVEAVDNASHPQRRILVVGDFPSHLVEDAAMSSLASIGSTLKEKPIQPVIQFWNLAQNSKQLANVSVDTVQIESPAVVAGRDASFSARIRNASDLPIRDLRVSWMLDGKALNPSTITIEPRSTATSRLSHRIESVGVHQLTVAVEHADALIEDNRRSIGVDVIREIHVMLVDGKPARGPLESETDYLAIALSPFAFGGEDQPDAVRTSIIGLGEIEQRITTESPDLIVLANVKSVGGKTRETIAGFVADGGALVIFDGDLVDPESYNQPWSRGDIDADNATQEVATQGEVQEIPRSWNLPAALGSFVGSAASTDADPLPLGGRNSIYSPWQVLGDDEDQTFADVDVYGYRKLRIADPAQKDPAQKDPAQKEPAQKDSGSTNKVSLAPSNREGPNQEAPIRLWNTQSGDPLVVSARRGRGRVVQFAIPCDTDWSTLPLRMVYLPMMQQMVLELAGSRKQATLQVGEGFSVPTAELAAIIPSTDKIDANQPESFWLEPARGAEMEMLPSKQASPTLTINSTESPGIYRLKKRTPLENAESKITSTIRVVEVPAVESQLRDADASRLSAAAGMLEANVYDNLESLSADEGTRRFGREIWRWLLVALLIVLVAELWLQQRTVKAARLEAS